MVPSFPVEIKISSFLNIPLKDHLGSIENLFLFDSGSSALSFVFGSKIFENKKIGLPIYSCASVYNSLIISNREIVPLDICVTNKGYEINLDDLQKCDVLLFIHFFGYIFSDFELIKKRYPELIIIEDCSHCLITSYKKNKNIFGAIFSFNFHKPIVAGIGGAFVINDLDYKDYFHSYYKNIEIIQNNPFRMNKLLRIFLKNTFYYKPLYFLYFTLLKKNKTVNFNLFNSEISIKRLNPKFINIINNQIEVSNNKCKLDNKYYLINELYRLPIQEFSYLCYFPLFIDNDLKRDALIKFFFNRKIDYFILWQNAQVYTKYLGYLFDQYNFEKSYKMFKSILFIPELLFNDKELVQELLYLLEE